MIIGITGGTGCGKTTLLKVIAEKGGLILDCDAIYHQLLATDASLLKAIENRFPGTVENGQLQRKKLGAIVFADQQALLDLNSITHQAVKAEVRVQRLMKRDIISEDTARSRIAAQHDEAWFRQRCDWILENNGTEMQFREKCLAFLENLDIIEE